MAQEASGGPRKSQENPGGLTVEAPGHHAVSGRRFLQSYSQRTVNVQSTLQSTLVNVEK